MMTAIVIWIIGWLFTFGWASKDTVYKHHAHADGFVFKVFVFMFTGFTWPVSLGQEFHLALKQITSKPEKESD